MSAQFDVPPVESTQGRYALVLLWGTRAGLTLLVVGFALYAFGVVPPHVPFDQMPRLWNQPVGTYLSATGQSSGWSWTNLVTRADIFNLVGISVLCGWSAVCLLAVMPLYARQGDRLFVGLCLSEIIVLALAASNIVVVGH